jgi:signal transduction protein with GAF and PtsI domain
MLITLVALAGLMAVPIGIVTVTLQVRAALREARAARESSVAGPLREQVAELKDALAALRREMEYQRERGDRFEAELRRRNGGH